MLVKIKKTKRKIEERVLYLYCEGCKKEISGITLSDDVKESQLKNKTELKRIVKILSSKSPWHRYVKISSSNDHELSIDGVYCNECWDNIYSRFKNLYSETQKAINDKDNAEAEAKKEKQREYARKYRQRRKESQNL